jgi:hypothetical protein
MDAVKGQSPNVHRLSQKLCLIGGLQIVEVGTTVQVWNSQHVMTGHAYDKKSDAENQRDEPAARLCIFRPGLLAGRTSKFLLICEEVCDCAVIFLF